MNAFSRKSVLLLAGVLLLGSSIFGQNGGLRFTLTDLGTFGGTWSDAWAINDQGVVVGTHGAAGGTIAEPYRNVLGATRCFIWQNGVTLTTFDGGTKPPRCEAMAIDLKGNVAGWMYTTKSGSQARAFHLDSGGRLTTFEPPPGYDATMGLGVYGRTIVGGVGNSTYWAYCDQCPFFFSGLLNPVKWDTSGTLTTIATKGAATFGNYARGINRNGEIVGSFYDYRMVRPWVWRSGVFSFLATPQSSQFLIYGEAFAINDRSFVVGGGSFDNGTNLNACAEVWSSLVPINQPGLLPNCVGNDAAPSGMSISADNWIVGYGHWEPRYPPFVYVPNPGCQLTDLNTLLDGSGKGWILVSANGINNLHRIVGSGISPTDGQRHAVLLTPNDAPLCFPK